MINRGDTKAARALDDFIPWRNMSTFTPNYESGLSFAVKNHVENRNRIVTVGGGYGVTVIKLAQKALEYGLVIVYEGFSDSIKNVRETDNMNSVGNIVDVHHRIVGAK